MSTDLSSQRADEAAWIGVYRETLRPLYAYVSRRAGGDRDLAEDVTHEAWLRALAAWRGSGFPDEPLAWLRATARNLLANHYRRQEPEAVDARALDLERGALEPETPDAAALLGWGLARLRAGQARLLEGYHLEGKGVAALASELGMSERAVEGRLRRSRLALRRLLQPYFIHQEQ
jgi:RNA polymerase sigma-70 factor (ECF subfamily)